MTFYFSLCFYIILAKDIDCTRCCNTKNIDNFYMFNYDNQINFDYQIDYSLYYNTCINMCKCVNIYNL